MKKAVIYCRSAIDKNKESLIGQENLCREYAQNNKLLVDKVFVDADVSGIQEEKPELKKLIDYAMQKNIRTVLVFRNDRLSRDNEQLALLQSKFESLGIKVYSISGSNLVRSDFIKRGLRAKKMLKV